MKPDYRLELLARNVLTKSVKLQSGEKIYLEGKGIQTLPLLYAFIQEACKLGATPFYFFNDTAMLAAQVNNSNQEQLSAFGKFHADIMRQVDAYVSVRGFNNVFDEADVLPAQMRIYEQEFFKKVHLEIRVPHTRWCVMRYPTPVMSALARMSTKQFEDFYFDACLVNYENMSKAMDSLVELMQKTDKVKIITPTTNLSFSIKDINVVKCHGLCNIPDGEVYTAPIKNSINGTIQFI